MGEIFRGNTVYKIVAISLALLLWLYVTADGNSPMERSYSLNIEYTNLSNELVLVEKTNYVDIKVRGEQNIIANLSQNDFRATVDASEVEVGHESLPILITSLTGVEIIERHPSEAKINADKVGEKQVPVNVALLGETIHGFSSFKATVKPSHVVLRGPANLLATIVEARVDVNLDSAHTNLTLNLPVKVQDQWGNAYGPNIFEMSPNTVEVFVPIIEDTPSKTVTVKHKLEGSLAAGYQLSRVVLEPTTVEILGSFSQLDAIDHIETVPISINGASGDIVKEVELVTPAGITLLNDRKIKVIIQIEEALKQNSYNLAVKVNNRQEEQEIEITTKFISVKVEGKANDMDNITAQDIEAFIDIAGLGQGTHEVALQVNHPPKVKVIEIEPIKVEVIIK